jgi:hypothetical protein
VTTPAVHQQPTPERFINAVNAYEQTEAMKAAVERLCPFLRCEATTAFNQISHAIGELDYFSLSLDVEIDCEITRGSAINRLF